jgi:hypothetical protein
VGSRCGEEQSVANGGEWTVDLVTDLCDEPVLLVLQGPHTYPRGRPQQTYAANSVPKWTSSRQASNHALLLEQGTNLSTLHWVRAFCFKGERYPPAVQNNRCTGFGVPTVRSFS